MSQEVLYRKWRPSAFGDVSGQNPIVTTLRNAVASGNPAHAYLFSGPRGTGKTSTARILAKAVNCEANAGGEPCGECRSCAAFAEGRALDLIELDAASNRGIDEVRALRESVGYAPNAAAYKVYLVDEVHMLTDAAFNALLKTLEEPPAHVIFVLATTEPHRIPPTISSRCQRFDFRRIALPDIAGRLHAIAAREGIEVAEGGMELIARQAGGSLRDAVNLLDQLAAYRGAALDLEAVRSGLGLAADDRAGQLARAAVGRDLAGGLALLGAVRDDGIEVRAFVRETVRTLRTLLMLRAGARDELGLTDGQLDELAPIAETAEAADIVAALRALGEIDFAGDNYDALPAEIAFAAHAVGLPPERDDYAASLPAGAPAPAGAVARADETAPSPADAAVPREDAPAAQPREAEPAPSPAAAEDGDAPSPELAALRERFGEIRDAARARHFKAGALLSSRCRVKGVDGDTVEIGFQSELLAGKALGDAEVLDAIREAVSAAAGRPVEVRPVVWDALRREPPSAPDAGAAADAPAAGGHIVEEALAFGGVAVAGD